MSDQMQQNQLIEQAAGGDRDALETLLIQHFDRLAAHIAPRLPADLKNLLSPEDVVQESCIVAFQRIDGFENRGEGAFFGWLARIAENCLMNAVKTLRAAKRGGEHTALTPDAGGDASGSIPLLEWLATHSWTASRSIARREEIEQLRAAIAGLDGDYREVLRLRYIESQPIAAIAERMGRSEGATHMLLSRALIALRSRLGQSEPHHRR